MLQRVESSACGLREMWKSEVSSLECGDFYFGLLIPSLKKEVSPFSEFWVKIENNGKGKGGHSYAHFSLSVSLAFQMNLYIFRPALELGFRKNTRQYACIGHPRRVSTDFLLSNISFLFLIKKIIHGWHTYTYFPLLYFLFAKLRKGGEEAVRRNLMLSGRIQGKQCG